MYAADLHIHSKYSRATARDCDVAHLDRAAREKGVSLVGTGDFTHPAWRAELRESLVRDASGFYTLKGALRLPAVVPNAGEPPRFIITGEISTIYKKNGKTRKVHSLILLPDLDAAERLSARLEKIGNIRSDGRPILGIDCRDLLEITLDACPSAVFIPAHIWTPHFSLFGAFSGFDTVEECFGDLSGEIHAMETGLSSDPPMNHCVSMLDSYTLVSNSDAHSPAKLAREANLFDAPLDYDSIRRAITTGDGFCGTIEFFPEEGKYHLDGHRTCGVCLTPSETEALGGKCPVCGKRITVGVMHRVMELSDRKEGFLPARARPFQSLTPLCSVIASALGVSADGNKARAAANELLSLLGTELFILREADLCDIARVAGKCVSESVRRLRAGAVRREAGYDGAYGKITLLDADERESINGQLALFSQDGAHKPRIGKATAPALPQGDASAQQTERASSAPRGTEKEELNEAQHRAVTSNARALAVIAGPGTGKTKTLVARIAYLIETRGVKPSEITAVTFTNQAAAEMRARLAARLGGANAIRGMTVGTFHAICRKLLPQKPICGEADALSLVAALLQTHKSDHGAKETLRRISLFKCGMSPEEANVDPALAYAYQSSLLARGVRDLDDLLLDALSLPQEKRRMFTHLLADEYQDVNAVQRRLIAHWAAENETLFVIGDPDQSIYGFRGSSAGCFDELKKAFPSLETITLSENYRSAPEILSCAASVIFHNGERERILLAALQSETANGAEKPVCLYAAESPYAEGIFIAKEISRMAGGTDMLSARTMETERASVRPFSDVAVLCRTRRQSELIESCLMHDGIPCVVVGRGDELLDESVRGALAFFRYLLDPSDTVSRDAALRLVYGEPIDSNALPEAFLADKDAFSTLLGKEKPRLILERWYARHGRNEAGKRLTEISAFHSDMKQFMDAILLGEEADLLRANGKSYVSGAVRLMTLHGAKGLEFPVVFLPGLNKGVFPSEREGNADDLCEERRLFFVGITRAKEALILSSSGEPSAFLAELPKAVRDGIRSAPYRIAASKQLSLF